MNREQSGFTIVELMVASTVGLIVMAGIVSVFIWALRAAYDCGQDAAAQTEAVQSSQRIMSYARNAMAVSDIDAAGTWVELSMPPTGMVSRFSYTNPTTAAGDGRLTLVRDVDDPNSTSQVVATAVTEVMSPPSRNVFQQTGPRSLRIAYRVAQPGRARICSAEVDVGIRLRNN